MRNNLARVIPEKRATHSPAKLHLVSNSFGEKNMKEFGNISHDELLSLVFYCPDDGQFYRKTSTKYGGGHGIGDVMGYKGKGGRKGYTMISVLSTDYPAAVLAWFYMTKEWPDCMIDHIDHDKSNDKFSNLTQVDYYSNAQNMPLRIDNKSGCPGVCWKKGKRKWRASITKNKVSEFLGYFDNVADAIRVRKQAEVRLGFGPNHGKPKEILAP